MADAGPIRDVDDMRRDLEEIAAREAKRVEEYQRLKDSDERYERGVRWGMHNGLWIGLIVGVVSGFLMTASVNRLFSLL